MASAEIEHLLKFVESSDCQFIRSGTEYSSKEASAHLRMKLGKAGDRVKSAEDFIEGIASKSYLTGKPYMVRLPGEEPKPCGPWLTEELARYRAGGAKHG